VVDREWLRQRRGAVIAAGVVVAVVAVVAVGLSFGDPEDTAAEPSPGASAASSSGPQATPSGSASGTSSPDSSPSGTAQPGGSESGTAGTGTPAAGSTKSPTAGPTTGPTTKSPRPTSTKATKTPTSLETVPVVPIETKPPVDVTATADFGTGLVVEVAGMQAVKGEAKVQGQIAGPAVRVTVKATNDSRETVSLAQSQVEMTYGQSRTPGVELSGPDVVPFPDSLAPGETASASFVFGIPLDERGLVQIVVYYATDAPIVVFQGAAP
jgi:hypothetical protein